MTGPSGSSVPSGYPPLSRIRAEGTARNGAVEVDESLGGEMLKAFRQRTELGAFASPCQVTGKSGVRHSFTFGFGDSPDVNVVGDVVVDSDPIDETKVLSLFIKVYDVGARHAVLCVVPSLTTEAKKLSNLYKIVAVESGDRTHLATMTSDVLGRFSKND